MDVFHINIEMIKRFNDTKTLTKPGYILNKIVFMTKNIDSQKSIKQSLNFTFNIVINIG